MADRREVALRRMRRAIVSLLLAEGLAIAAHLVDDRLLPVHADRSQDLSLPYLVIIGAAAIVVAGMRAGVVFRQLTWRILAVCASCLCLLPAIGWFSLIALGDWAGSSYRTCAPGAPTVTPFATANSQQLCAPSPLADRIQLPLHLGVTALLLVALVFAVGSFIASLYGGRSAAMPH
jgi:hypothetical protein